MILHRTTIAFKVEILSFSLIVLMSDSELCVPDPEASRVLSSFSLVDFQFFHNL